MVPNSQLNKPHSKDLQIRVKTLANSYPEISTK